MAVHWEGATAAPNGAPPRSGMVWIPGGTFRMGSVDFYPEERPIRDVTVRGFWIDRHPVTNQQFSRFVAATGYVTMAERALDPDLYPGAPSEQLDAGSMVFTPTIGPVDLERSAQWWSWTPGADWRHPQGPGSSIAALALHPVVHGTVRDAEAYCTWTGAVLPTEAEWEYAARGGLDGANFCWGNEERPGGEYMANTWQGHFPWLNTKEDGYEYTSPIGSFPANGYGLLDMAGNVWEWTADWYAMSGPMPPDSAERAGQRGHGTRRALQHVQYRVPRKVVKGGSYLCASGYSFRYRPAARQAQEIDMGMSDLGFRCVVRSRRTLD